MTRKALEQDLFAGEVIVSEQRLLTPGGFAVYVVEAGGDRFCARGQLGALSRGQRVRVRGRFCEHERHGRQLAVSEMSAVDSSAEVGALAFLQQIDGIGEARARALICAHGDVLFSRLDADAHQVFSALKGMSAGAAAKAATSWGAWQRRRPERDLHLLLGPAGLGRLIARLVRRHGAAAAELVRRDPYRLVEEHGVGFLSADRLALSVGVPRTAPARVEACVLHVLEEASEQGHSHLSHRGLSQRMGRFTINADPVVLQRMTARGLIASADGRVARPALAAAERDCARALRALTVPHRPPPRPDPRLSEQQRRAVAGALTVPLSAICGGAGTGKTTVVGALARAAATLGVRLRLCAPTAKAAERMYELAGMRASTVHRLLEWGRHGPTRGPGYPLQADLVVCDESSMLDLETFAALCRAIGPNCGLCLVGDEAQLAPVGAGRPFLDVLESGAASVVRLDQIMRQRSGSRIVRAAHELRRGRPPHGAGAAERDLFFVDCPEPQELRRLVVELCARRLPEHFGVAAAEVQVLSPIHSGPAGVSALSAALAARMNPDGHEVLGGRLCIGDKVVQTRNDYEAGLLNGQVGRLVAATRQGVVLDVEGRRVEVSPRRAGSIRRAYAMTIHRAQGSEADVVVIAVLAAHAHMLSRNLLYTALTRARRGCVICGELSALEAAARKVETQRSSALGAMLSGAQALRAA